MIKPTQDQPQAGTGSLSLVFHLPRFHTNLFYGVKALVDAGHKVHLICENRDGIEDHSIIKPIYLTPDKSFGTILSLLDKLAPDALFLRDFTQVTRRFFWAARLRGVRVFGYDQKPLYRRRSLGKILTAQLRGRPTRRITPVIGLDRSSRPDRWANYVPFPVNQPSESERHYAPGGKVRILCVGKLAQERKNHHLLIAALARLKEINSFSLTLVGSSRLNLNGGSEDYRNSLYAEAEVGSLAGQTKILADVPFQDMADIYKTHDICVLPSRDEPLGSAPLEAMAYGCIPIISTGCGSAGSIQGTKGGFVVEVGDVDALTETLRPLIAEPEQLARLGKRALCLIKEEFVPERFVARIEMLVSANPATR